MKTLDMTEGKPVRLILKFAVPLFIGMLFQQVYNITDTMIVGYGLGENAVAAVGATSALYSVLINFANGLNNGYGIIISQAFGGRNWKKLRQGFAAMVILDVGITLILTLVSLILLKPLLFWLETPAEIFQQAHQYIAIILAGMITTIAYNMGAGFLRAVGNSRIPLYFLVISCGLNILMDLLFVMVFQMGVKGAAAATVIAQGISACLCLGYITKKYREFLPQKQEWRLSPGLTWEMLSTGLSMGLMLSVFSIGSVFLQKAVNLLDSAIITANTASRKVYELWMMPLATMSTANATFAGQNYGAKKLDRIYLAMRQVIGMELIWSAVSVIIALLTGRILVQILIGTSDPFIIDNAVLNLRICTLFFFPLGALLVLRNTMQPMGYKISPVISSGIELGLKVLFAYAVVPKIGYLGVVITEPIIWVVCAVYLACVFWIGQRKQRREGQKAISHRFSMYRFRKT